MALVYFDDAAAYAIEESAVVRDQEQGKAVPAKEFFQPFGHFQVQVVSRLVHEKEVGPFEQDPGQSGFFLLPARKLAHFLFHPGQFETEKDFFYPFLHVPSLQLIHLQGQIIQGRLQRSALFLLHSPEQLIVLPGHLQSRVVSGKDEIHHVLVRIENRVLRQEIHPDAFAERHLPGIRKHLAHDDVQQSGLPGPVLGHQGHFFPFFDPEAKVGEKLFFPVGFS